MRDLLPWTTLNAQQELDKARSPLTDKAKCTSFGFKICLAATIIN